MANAVGYLGQVNTQLTVNLGTQATGRDGNVNIFSELFHATRIHFMNKKDSPRSALGRHYKQIILQFEVLKLKFQLNAATIKAIIH